MTSLAARVAATIRRRRLLPAGSRVAVAVSGGADSVALVLLLTELAAAGRLTLAGLAHLDHGLRGDESSRDARFCRELAARLSLPFDVERVDVAAEARAGGRSREQAARDARYAYFERARLRLGADVVAVAHTRDDQAETVLLRLFRGAGTRGIAGIPARRGTIVRPLLDLQRGELRRYLTARGEPWMEDSTNADESIPRNWVRHRLLPQVVDRFGAGTAHTIARTADLARADDEVLSASAAELMDVLARPSARGLALDRTGLAAAPAALRRRVILTALERTGGTPPAATHVEAVLELLRAGRPVATRVGACRVELSAAGGVLMIRRCASSGGRVSRPAPWMHTLTVPGQVVLPEAGGRLRAERAAVEALGGFDSLTRGGSLRAVAAGVGSDLVVRSWRPGDALQVLGSSGRKKVQDLFVDRKVPRPERHRVPLVLDGDGRIVWVVGHALGEAFRVTPASTSVVVLDFELLGGPD